MVKIKFKTKKDQINGFYELATKGRGRSLPHGIFEVANRYLKILDGVGIWCSPANTLRKDWTAQDSSDMV